MWCDAIGFSVKVNCVPYHAAFSIYFQRIIATFFDSNPIPNVITAIHHFKVYDAPHNKRNHYTQMVVAVELKKIGFKYFIGFILMTKRISLLFSFLLLFVFCFFLRWMVFKANDEIIFNNVLIDACCWLNAQRIHLLLCMLAPMCVVCIMWSNVFVVRNWNWIRT